MNDTAGEGRLKKRRKQRLGKYRTVHNNVLDCVHQTASWRFNCNIQMNGNCYPNTHTLLPKLTRYINIHTRVHTHTNTHRAMVCCRCCCTGYSLTSSSYNCHVIMTKRGSNTRPHWPMNSPSHSVCVSVSYPLY